MHPNISFFDSGQGGLTIWENVVRHFPNINTIYLGDNARCPYGNKSPQTIMQYAQQAGSFLSSQNAHLLVIVCGTASSVATESLQKSLNIPVIGIVEGLCQYTDSLVKNKQKPIAVLATKYTIQSEKFQNSLKFYGMTNVWARACPLFVPLIEEGISTGQIVENTCDLYLNDIPVDVQVVLLACTHYPRIAHAIGKYLNGRTGRQVILKSFEKDILIASDILREKKEPIYLVEASSPIIESVKNFLDHVDYNPSVHEIGVHRTLCTDSPEQFGKVANYFTQFVLPKIELVQITKDL